MATHAIIGCTVSCLVACVGWMSPAFCQDAQTTADGRQPAMAWKLAGEPRYHLKREAFEGFNFVRPFDQGRKALVAYYNDQALSVIDLETGEKLFDLPADARHTEDIMYCDAAEDGSWAVTVGGTRDESVRIWDLKQRSLRAIVPLQVKNTHGMTILQGQRAFVRVENYGEPQIPPKLIKYSADGELLKTVNLDAVPETPLEFNSVTGLLTFSSNRYRGRPSTVVQFNGDLKLVNRFQIGNDKEACLVYRAVSIGNGRVLTFEFSDVSGHGPNIRVNTCVIRERVSTDGRPIRQWYVHFHGDKGAFAVSPDGSTIAVPSGWRFRLFDTGTGAIANWIEQLEGYHSAKQAAFLESSKRILVFGRTDIFVWDLENVAVEPAIVVAQDRERISADDLKTLIKPGTTFHGILRREGLGEAEVKISGLGGTAKQILASLTFVKTHPRGMQVDTNEKKFECVIQIDAGRRASLVITEMKAAPKNSLNLILDSSIQGVPLQSVSGDKDFRLVSPDKSISLELFRDQ